MEKVIQTSQMFYPMDFQMMGFFAVIITAFCVSPLLVKDRKKDLVAVAVVVFGVVFAVLGVINLILAQEPFERWKKDQAVPYIQSLSRTKEPIHSISLGYDSWLATSKGIYYTEKPGKTDLTGVHLTYGKDPFRTLEGEFTIVIDLPKGSTPYFEYTSVKHSLSAKAPFWAVDAFPNGIYDPIIHLPEKNSLIEK